MIVRDWSTPQNRQSTLDLLPTIDKLWASPANTRDRVKAQFGQALLESLSMNREAEQARWLLDIYDAGRAESVGKQEAGASGHSSDSKALTGKWRATPVAASQYKNSYTGAPAPTSGNSFSYEFFPDGIYHSTNRMQVTTDGCTSSVYNENSGRFRTQGDHLYIEPISGHSEKSGLRCTRIRLPCRSDKWP